MNKGKERKRRSRRQTWLSCVQTFLISQFASGLDGLAKLTGVRLAVENVRNECVLKQQQRKH